MDTNTEPCYLPWIQRQLADQTGWKSSLVLPDSTLPWTELLGARCFLWQPLHNGWPFITSRWLQVLFGRCPVSKTLKRCQWELSHELPLWKQVPPFTFPAIDTLEPTTSTARSCSFSVIPQHLPSLEKTTKVLHTDTLTVKPPVSVETGHTLGSLH